MSHLPRESTYPVPSSDFLSYLDECVSTTEACSSTLSSGLYRLQPGTQDLPRLARVLRNQHHFLVLPQPVVQAHKSVFSSAVAPQIESLMSKAEHQLEVQAGRVSRLEERLTILQSARLPKHEERAPVAGREEQVDQDDGRSKLEGLEMKELNPAQRRKLLTLRGKRERLEKERARLNGEGD